MSVYFEEARRFGQYLLTSPQAIKMTEAKVAYERDEAAKRKMESYMAYQESIQQGLNQGALQEAEIAISKENLQNMLKDMKADPVINDLIQSEAEYNAFLNQIFGILRMTIGFSGCGGCSGCESTH